MMNTGQPVASRPPVNPKGRPEEELSAGQFFLEMVKVFLLAAVIIIPVRVFLFQPFFVQGSSMHPNFENGEYLVVNEFGYKHTAVGLSESPIFTVSPFHSLSRQEPIVFRSPQKEGLYLIKRVIGLPGETVRIERSKVIISDEEHPDGFVLDESEYLAPSVATTDMKPVVLGDNQYFVLGDNRMNSLDSRVFGPIDRNAVVGRVLFRAWPLTRAEWYR
ncbi:MAG: signal peptidase I [Candidatus Moranbacteria bacterium]|nr:signal peptidase I [Candidatus Moranbacteria bacterium]